MALFKTPKKWDLLFFIVLIGVAFLYSYQNIFWMRPYSIHQWRQTDCLSIALNYYQEGMHFLSPSVHMLGPSGNGMTSTSECPLIYYLVAILWKIFGYHEFIYRMLDTFIAFSGLYALFLLVKEMTSDGAWALLISILLFTSPIFAVYSNNFLMDVPALSFALMGWYYFVRYYKTKRMLFFYVSIFIFLLAGLTKITGLISFIPLIFILFYEIITFRKNKNNKLFTSPLIQVLTILAAGLLMFSWTLYSIHYNQIHNAGLFSTDILPLWKLDKSAIHDTLVKLYTLLLPQYFSMPILFLTLLLFVSLLINHKKISKFYLWFLTMLFTGIILYLVLWFQVLNVHDYYLINLLIFVPATLVAFLIFLKDNYPAIFSSVKLKFIFSLFLLFNIYYCAVETNIRYSTSTPIVKYNFIIDDRNSDFWNWYHFTYVNETKAFETITPYLRRLGISRTDKVISIPDQSINITLYLMDQKGFDDFGYGGFANEGRINEFIRLGAKYLIVSKPSYLDYSWIKPYLKYKIGNYQNVSIYDLRNLN